MKGDTMYDVIIVGGGISGVYSAHLLLSFNSNLKIKLIEGRDRLGGRLYSPSGHDMGGSWSWPESDSYVNAIVKELKIPTIVESSAQIRFLGGSQQLVTKLAQNMLKTQNGNKNNVHDNNLDHIIRLQEEVTSITKKHEVDEFNNNKLVIQTKSHKTNNYNDEITKVYETKAIILAVPPKLIVSKIIFNPPLPADTREAIESTPTWMAGASKVFLEFSRPFWCNRKKSISPTMPFLLPTDVDNAAPVIYDASQSTNEKYALCAFYAEHPKQINLEYINRSLIPALETVFFNGDDKNLLKDSLLKILFHNWIDDPWTCDDPKSLLLNQSHTSWDDMYCFGNSKLRKPLFEKSLYLASTETEKECGHIQGALKSAQRVVNQLLTNGTFQK